MFSGLESPAHLLMLGLLVILLFGAKRLPEIGRSLGTGMREFKDSVTSSAPAAPLEIASVDEGRLHAHEDANAESRRS
jgi:sec-independent protein translocase protein TatA